MRKAHFLGSYVWRSILCTCITALLLSSCASSRKFDNIQQIAHAGLTLGIDIGYKDNHTLYIEAASWLATPYLNGGTTKQGVDCSGLTQSIYRTVYHTDIARNSADQMKQDCHRRIRKHKLREGDLVFFSSPSSRGRCAHVGLFLKDKKFIHASTSRGVMVSSLDEDYWKRYWMRGGRIVKHRR